MDEFNIDTAWFDKVKTLEEEYNRLVIDKYEDVKKIYTQLNSDSNLSGEAIDNLIGVLDILVQCHKKLNDANKDFFSEVLKIEEYLKEVEDSSVYKELGE